MLRLRLATAAVGVPAVIALAIIGGPAFVAVLALLIAVGHLEFCNAAGLGWRSPETLLGAALAGALVPAAYADHDVQQVILVAAIVVPLFAVVVRGARATEPERALPAWLVIPAATLYVGWLGLHLLLVRRLPDGARWLLLLLLSTFAIDTSAYAVGRLLGRHKLAPRISPAKTVEGAIGGLLGGTAAVVALVYLLRLPRNLPLVIALGVAVGVVAQLGDLAESAVKRRLGVKDMGRIFPGHGGVLDRLDSLLFVSVLLYYFVRWAIL